MTHRIILSALAGLLVVALGVRPARVAAEGAPKRVELVARRFTYQPSELTLKKGEPVVLTIRSEDVPHGLRIRDLNVEVRVSKGGTSEVSFTPEKTGDFTGHCWVFCGSGHGGMALTVHVVD
jgi:cytochrome c oxidase subunit II